MASPFWNYPGVRNGRIIPRRASPQGSEEDWYYGFVSYTYSYTYDYYSGQVFCLGSDGGSQPVYLPYNYVAKVEQSLDLTGIDLIYFCWYLLTPSSMPEARYLQQDGPIDLVEQYLIQQPVVEGRTLIGGDSCQGVVLPEDATSLLAKDESSRLIKITGSGHNDGYHLLRAVPWELHDDEDTWGVTANPGANQRRNGQVAMLDDLVEPAESPASATVMLLGARWLARAYVDGSLRVELEEKPGRAWQRNYMALHVSKATGVHTITFALELDALVEPE